MVVFGMDMIAETRALQKMQSFGMQKGNTISNMTKQ